MKGIFENQTEALRFISFSRCSISCLFTKAIFLYNSKKESETSLAEFIFSSGLRIFSLKRALISIISECFFIFYPQGALHPGSHLKGRSPCPMLLLVFLAADAPLILDFFDNLLVRFSSRRKLQGNYGKGGLFEKEA